MCFKYKGTEQLEEKYKELLAHFVIAGIFKKPQEHAELMKKLFAAQGQITQKMLENYTQWHKNKVSDSVKTAPVESSG